MVESRDEEGWRWCALNQKTYCLEQRSNSTNGITGSINIQELRGWLIAVNRRLEGGKSRKKLDTPALRWERRKHLLGRREEMFCVSSSVEIIILGLYYNIVKGKSFEKICRWVSAL